MSYQISIRRNHFTLKLKARMYFASLSFDSDQYQANQLREVKSEGQGWLLILSVAVVIFLGQIVRKKKLKTYVCE